MAALSPELLYFASRMSGFSTNHFRIETNNQSEATSNSIIAFDLPANSICNLRSFKVFAKMDADEIAAAGGRIPSGGLKDLIERVEVSMGGIVLSQGTNFTNVLSAAKRAVSEYSCDSVLGHPEMIRAKSYVNPADTYTTTANEADASTHYCIDEWEGFLGTADPMLFDFSLVPNVKIRLYCASDSVLSNVPGVTLGVASGSFADSAGTDATTGAPLPAAPNSTKPKYRLSDIHATIECINLASAEYENMLASQMQAQGDLEVPYKAFYTFVDTHTGSSKFSVSASSLDRIWLAWRGSDFNSVTNPITVQGYKQEGGFVSATSGGSPTVDLGEPQYDQGGVLGTNAEKYVGRYFNFSQPVAWASPTTAWKAQLQLNGAYMPQFSAGVEELYGITRNSIEGARKAKHMTLDQYRKNFCVQAFRLNMPNSEYSRSLSGVDSRATNLQGIVRTESAATSLSPNLTIFCETTEVLNISAGRAISVTV